MSARRVLLVVAFFGVVLAFPYTPLATEYRLGLLVLIVMYGYMNLCWNIAGGYAGILSLAHGAFWGIGAYTSTMLFLEWGISPWLGMVAGALLAAAFGVVLSLGFRYRVKGLYFAMVSLALAFVVRGVVSNSREMGGATGLLLPLRDEPHNLLFFNRAVYATIITLFLLGLVILLMRLKNSRMGDAWRAIREDDDAAEALGIATFRYRTWAMGLSAALVAPAGSFYAQYVLFVDPETMLGLHVMITMLLGTLLGGVGTIPGPILGAIFFVSITEVIQGYVPPGTAAGAAWGLIIYSVVLIGIVLSAPNGLMGIISAGMRRLRPARQVGEAVSSGVDPDALARLVRSEGRTAPTAPSTLLSVDGVSVRFGGVQALDKVSFGIDEGSLTAIIGPNGAGKSTLFNVVTGFIPPTGGQVTFAGEPATGHPHQLCLRGLVRTFQHVHPFLESTVEENVRVAARAGARDGDIEGLVEAVLRGLGLHGCRQRPAAELTAGDKKRLELARALATRPRLLLLDEIMAGLSHQEIQDLSDVIRAVHQAGMTVVLIEHVLKAVVDLAQTVFVLDKGQMIASGDPGTVMENEQVIQSYLGSRRPVPQGSPATDDGERSTGASKGGAGQAVSQ